jgi:hypothetical protein
MKLDIRLSLLHIRVRFQHTMDFLVADRLVRLTNISNHKKKLLSSGDRSKCFRVPSAVFPKPVKKDKIQPISRILQRSSSITFRRFPRVFEPIA